MSESRKVIRGTIERVKKGDRISAAWLNKLSRILSRVAEVVGITGGGANFGLTNALRVANKSGIDIPAYCPVELLAPTDETSIPKIQGPSVDAISNVAFTVLSIPNGSAGIVFYGGHHIVRVINQDGCDLPTIGRRCYVASHKFEPFPPEPDFWSMRIGPAFIPGSSYSRPLREWGNFQIAAVLKNVEWLPTTGNWGGIAPYCIVKHVGWEDSVMIVDWLSAGTHYAAHHISFDSAGADAYIADIDGIFDNTGFIQITSAAV